MVWADGNSMKTSFAQQRIFATPLPNLSS